MQFPGDLIGCMAIFNSLHYWKIQQKAECKFTILELIAKLFCVASFIYCCFHSAGLHHKHKWRIWLHKLWWSHFERPFMFQLHCFYAERFGGKLSRNPQTESFSTFLRFFLPQPFHVGLCFGRPLFSFDRKGLFKKGLLSLKELRCVKSRIPTVVQLI